MNQQRQQPFRPPHGEDCPVCYPDGGRGLMTIGMMVVIVGVALVIVLVMKILAALT